MKTLAERIAAIREEVLKITSEADKADFSHPYNRYQAIHALQVAVGVLSSAAKHLNDVK